MRAEPASLELRIDYQFSHAELLRRALTHSSLANESHTGASSPLNDNEQLEFLGDSVLGFLVAEALVRRFPEYREGELSRLKAHLVSAAHLHGVARRLDLGGYLELGRSEEMSGGRAKKTLLVDALEAIIAAIWLDGGLEAARSFVAAHVLDAPFSGDEEAGTDIQPAITNFKSALRGTGAGAQAAAAALHHCAGARPGALQDVHGRGAGGQGLGRTGRRPHQEDRRAEGGARSLRAAAARGVPGFAARRAPTMEPARQHERLHEPGGIRQHRKIRKAFLVVPRHADHPVPHAGSLPGGAEHRPRPRSRLRHGLLLAPASDRTRLAGRALGFQLARPSLRARDGRRTRGAGRYQEASLCRTAPSTW